MTSGFILPLLAEVLATKGELLFSFLYIQLLLVVTYICFKHDVRRWLPWVLMFGLCLTYFFDTDYFSYKEDYEAGLPIVGYKDPFYLKLRQLSFGCYTLWRAYVWGMALLLFRWTCKRFEVGGIIAIYVLVMFYAPLFAYGRVILAMATYFFGYSFLVKPIPQNRITSFIIGTIIICLSYLGHRSFLVIIALTPLFLTPLTRKRLIYLLISFPFICLIVNLIFSSFLSSEIQLSEQFSSFQESAERTVGHEVLSGRNWKAELVHQIRLFSFYVPTVYILWKYIIRKVENIEDKHILQLLFTVTFITLFSVAILYFMKTGESEITGKRYLFMTGIPLCIIISHLYDYYYCTKREMNYMVITGFVFWETLLYGYYLSNGF